MLIESPGGAGDPIDNRSSSLDLARQLAAPAVIVAPPQLDAFGQTLLAVSALRSAGVTVRGIVINRYPAEQATADQEALLRGVERWSGVPLLAVIPEDRVSGAALSEEIVAPVARVDWASLAVRS